MSEHNGAGRADNGRFPLTQLPAASAQRLALRITPTAERAVRQGHPWLFASAIQRQSHAGRAGDLAVLFDRKGRFLAVGLYDPTAPIRVRILQAGEPATIDGAWFAQRMAAAAARRPGLPAPHTTGYRAVHGENDGLPGLVLDRYGETAVLKLDTPAWVPHLVEVVAAAAAVLPSERIILRLSRSVQEHEDTLFGLKDGVVLDGAPLRDSAILFQENGLTFEADVRHGQKTGFFLDQRDNRARVERLAAGKDVLNVFAYSGGFSLYAARGGAARVVSLDINQPALAAAMRNFRHNQHHPAVAAAEHELLLGDAFHVLQQLRESRRRFDLVVVDPPSFARKRDEVERALGAYERLARLGLGVLRPGGTLVAASCSSRVPAEHFFERIHQAAQRLGRPLRELERTFQPIDHPIAFKEGAYLKCLFATG